MNQEQWDELSAEFQESRDRSFTEVERADAQRRFVLLIVKNFPAILAEREATQRGEFICKSCGIRKDSDATKDAKINPQF